LLFCRPFECIYRDIEYDYDGLVSRKVTNPYNSANEPVLDQTELRSFLLANQLLEETPEKMEHPSQRYWPGNDSGDDSCAY
jgi:hypothetical protein